MPYFPPPNERDTSPHPPVSPRRNNRGPVERVKRDDIEDNNASQDNSAIRALEIHIQVLRDELESQRDIAKQKDAQLHQTNTQLQRKTDAYDVLQKQFEEKCDLLEHRTMKLRVAEKFMTRDDEVTEQEIKNALEGINSQILTIAVSCSSLQNLASRFGKLERRTNPLASLSADEVYNHLELFLGHNLLGGLMLRHLSYSENGVTIAMQSLLCIFMTRFIETFPFTPMDSGEPHVSDILDGYQNMREAEMQLTSSLWRSLMSKYIRTYAWNDALRETLEARAIKYLVRILQLAGVSDDVDALNRHCKAYATSRLGKLFTDVAKLAQTIKEGVFSTDYVVFSAYPSRNNIYEEDTMKLQYDLTEVTRRKLRENKRVPVMCTTELGLIKETKVEGTYKEFKQETVRRATVILDWELDAMFKKNVK